MKNLWQFPNGRIITGNDILELVEPLLMIDGISQAFLDGAFIHDLKLSHGSLNLRQGDEKGQWGEAFAIVSVTPNPHFVCLAAHIASWTKEQLAQILRQVGLIPAPDDADEITE